MTDPRCEQGWVTQAELRDLLRHPTGPADDVKAWRIGTSYTTVRTSRDGATWRRQFETPGLLAELREDLLRAKLHPGVSSWSGVWRQYRIFPPRGSAGWRSLLETHEEESPRAPSPWIEERGPQGRHEGPEGTGFAEWDLRSAYAWATTEGLPDPRTVRRIQDPARAGIDDNAIYLVRGVRMDRVGPELAPNLLPTYLRRIKVHHLGDLFAPTPPVKPVWVLGETLNGLALAVDPEDMIAGWEWRRRVDLRPTFDRVHRQLPRWWKAVFRSHWGDWGGTSSVVYERWKGGALVTSSTLPTGLRCPPWAWTVQARVSSRVAHAAEDALRIFVDSVVITDRWRPSPRGPNLGDWRCVDRMPAVHLRGLPWRAEPAERRVDARRAAG